MLLRPYRRGRLQAARTFRSMFGAAAMFRALAPLGPAPAKPTDYVTAVNIATCNECTRGMAGTANNRNWGMMGNNVAGNCTFADSGHEIMLHTANAGTIIIPTTEQVLAAYSQDTGFDQSQVQPDGSNPTDTGASLWDACMFMQKVGICGQKSAGGGAVDPSRLEHIKWCVQIFGACRLGIMVTDSMEDQFTAGQPWTKLDDNNPGPHDLPLVDYDDEYGYGVTWGGLVAIAWSLLGQGTFLQEARAEVYPDFVRAGGTSPDGFDLDGMLGELPAVA